MTFSVPEINDFKARATTIGAFGDFSTIEFTMIGFGEPRVVQAGVVGGSYFEVMGLRPVLGRLLDAADDGAGRGGRGGADASLLDHVAQQRSDGHRQDDPPRPAQRRRSSACSSRRCRIRPTPRSSPTW